MPFLESEHLTPSSFVTSFLIYKLRDSQKTEMDPSPRKMCDPFWPRANCVFITCCYAVQGHDYLDKTLVI